LTLHLIASKMLPIRYPRLRVAKRGSMKFTDRFIRALRPKAERYEVWEGGRPGFGIRVSSQGRKTFIYLYRFQGKPRRLSLGAYPAMSLVDAHVAHANAKKALDQGIDPGAVDQAVKEEERRAPTVAALANEYLERHAKPNKRSWQEDARILRKDVLPAWGNRKAKDVTRRDIISLLDAIVDRGAPIGANRTLAVVRRMFNFALERGVLDATPCAAVKAPSKENQRDRVLNDKELRAFWHGLDRAAMSEGIRLALRLQLLTAQRKGEVIALSWNQISSEVWTIPAGIAKNKHAHRIPLSVQALALLDYIKAHAGASRWAFPSPSGKGHITPEAVDHAIRNNRQLFGINPFTPHDLRRTVASHMTAMGISRLVVGKILNHVESGVTKVYDRHSYDGEKRQALEAWGRRLEAIVRGEVPSKVVVLRT
jgi:integrase